jgi:hypothetical protein
MVPEEMTDRQILAHCRKIKRQVAKERHSMTKEEQQKRDAEWRKEIKEVYGLNLIYVKSRDVDL